MARDGKRVELVDETSSSDLPAYIGLGLIASLIIGFGPLADAFEGHGSFESAITRFLACVGVCVVAATVLGRILDSAPPEELPDEDGGSERGEPTGPAVADGVDDSRAVP